MIRSIVCHWLYGLSQGTTSTGIGTVTFSCRDCGVEYILWNHSRLPPVKRMKQIGLFWKEK